MINKVLKQKIVFLDLLRSVAIICVLMGHFLENNIYLNSFADSGVDIFFVLSGYLVCKSLFETENKPTQSVIIHFIKNRFLKIVPSYLVFFFLSIFIFTFVLPNIKQEIIPQIQEWRQYLMFYRNYGGPPARLPYEHLWSISAEIQFYGILLISYLVLKNHKKVFLICWLSIAFISIFWKIQAQFTFLAEWPTYTHNRIDSFAWGIIAYLVPFKVKSNWQIVLPVLIIIFISSIPLDIQILHLYKRILIPVCMYFIINSFENIKNHAIATTSQVIAKYSYNAYLWHFPIQFICNELHFQQSILIMLGITIAFSIVFTELVEIPFLKLKAKT